ncbi:MAG: hypothetical protein K2L22_09460, partial [Muribaculaceae bacterium]|nr:hypothetical protein [Muribaculaceae bacterium]
MKKFLLLSAVSFMAAGAMAQLAPGEYYIKNVETGEFLNEGYSWGTHAVTKAYPCAFNITPNKPQEEGAWKLVGIEDNSTPFWSTWSEQVDLTGNGTLHYEFYNYTVGNENWQNWGLVLTNGVPRGGEGYHEYMYLRADAWGWGVEYEATNGGNAVQDHNFNWDTFKTDMEGALVNIDITRNGSNVKVEAKIKTVEGKDFYENVSV